METFTKHPIHTGYEIGTEGTVNGPRRLNIGATKTDGYRYVWIAYIKAFRYIHRLVWETYKGPIPPGMEINHKDGNKANCAFDNLELMTHAQNVQHRFDVLGHVGNRTRTKHTPLTKAKMALKKVGINHPKFKGWYVINGVEYPSLRQAAHATGLDARTIKIRCNGRETGYNFKYVL